MAIIRRTDYAARQKEDVASNEDTISLDRDIYRKLGDITRCRTITVPTEINSEYDRFLLDMQEYQDTGVPPYPALADLDEYLGKLGVSETYPFADDNYEGFELNIWAQEPFREVVNGADDVINGTDNIVYATQG